MSASGLSLPLHDQQMSQVDWHFLGRTRAATEQQAVHFGQVFALDKELVERWMTPVGRLGREHNLTVAGEHQPAGMATVTGQGDAPNLDVVVGRDCDLHPQRDVVV
jgi:hypothetical protein